MMVRTDSKAFGEFLRFCVVGTVATGIDAAIFNAVLLVAPYRVALVSGYCLSLVVNYLLTIYWTFRRRPSVGNLFAVVGAHLLNLFVVRMGLMYLFVDVGQMGERLAYWPTLAISVVTNFVVVRLVVTSDVWDKKCFSDMMYKLIFSPLWLLSLLPLRVLYWLSDGLYWLVYGLLGYRVGVVRRNLAASFPEKGEAELREIERRFYHHFCDYIVETVKMISISEREIRRRMTFKGVERFEQSVKEGRSCGVYLGHLGNWEWITTLPLWVKSERAQCAQIYHPLENSLADGFFLLLRERWKALCIPMTETIRKIVSQENEGKRLIVGFISDQVPMWWNIHYWTDFLHHDTPVFTGTERIIKKRGMDAYYMHVTMPRRGYYECDIRLLSDDTRSTEEFELTEKYFRALEKNIQEMPHIWLWSHNRWKRTREEFNERFYVKGGKVFPKDHPDNH